MTNHARRLMIALLLGSFAAINAVADTHYVMVSSVTPVAPYTNWTKAASTIQAAVDCASPGDLVLVSNGVYSVGWRAVAVLRNRIVITNEVTVQSVNGPETTSIVGQRPSGYGGQRCAYVGDGSVLSGFTLRNGATLSFGNNEDQSAGGVWCTPGAVVSNCIIAGNDSAYQGGGAYGGTLIACILTNNTTISSGGGAIQSTLRNCTVSKNSSGFYGGGASGCTLNNCRVTGNTAYWGGGVSGCDLKSCLLTGNTASYGGGTYGSNLSGCTLIGNSAGQAGGGTEGGSLVNCILYSNNAPFGANWDSGRSNPVTLNYCCTSPLPSGPGNVDADPTFISTNDFHLQPSSPCINAGENQAWMANMVDLDGQPRIQGGIADMGAYESVISILTVVSKWGVPLPPVGNYRIVNGTTVTNFVSDTDERGQTRYICAGWTANGHDPASGNSTNAVLTVTNNITLTWNWQAQHWFSASADIGGAVDTSNGWINAGSLVTATAIANVGYHFLRWTGDVTAETPVLQTKLNCPLSVTAIFGVDTPSTVDNFMGATNITSTAASLNGVILSTGTAASETAVRVYWGLEDGGTSEEAWDSVSDLGELGLGAFTARVSNLVSNSFYYYRVWSSNSVGVSWAPAASPFMTLCGFGPTTRYVNIMSTTPIVPYLTWSTATTNIQDAVDVATAGDTVMVQDGSYCTGGRTAIGYQLNRVAVTKPITVRSVNGPGVTTILGPGFSEPRMRGVWLASGACLDGFTVTGGYAMTEDYLFPSDGWLRDDGYGGGVFGETITAVVTNCVITGNLASILGGGAHGCTLLNCTLSGNLACVFGYTQTRGGGASACALLNCTLTGNFATGMSGCDTGGGACDSTLRNCILSGNGASLGGGGTDNCGMYNCVLTDNSADHYGGGTYGGTLYNCTIIGNSVWYSHTSAGIYGSTAYNCIVWDNLASIAWGGSLGNCADSALSFSCTSPLPPGEGNTDADPMFVSATDFHLQAASPCINTGTNQDWMIGTLDLDSRPRIRDGHVDMGAYERFGLEEALDCRNLVWSSGGETNWYAQTLVSADGIDAAQSGPIGDNAETWLQADISSSGTLSFRWRVSCQYRYDMLTFYVDSTVYRSVSGETDWQDVSVFVPPGTHTFRWVYRKGKSGAAGADCGWVDEVNWTPGVPGAAWTLTVASTNGFGAPMPDVGTYSFTNGTVITASVTSPVLVITNVERRLCSGWTRTGILPESGDGTATRFMMTTDSALTWLWRTQYLLNTETSGGGMVDCLDAWLDVGTNVMVTATADPGWRFDHWSGDLSDATIQGLSVTVPIDHARDIIANFIPFDLAEALDTTNLIWTTGGSAVWTPQTGITWDGVDAAISGRIGDYEESWMQTTVVGSGTLTFYWRCDSETDYDYLTFMVDGEVWSWLTGDTGWNLSTYNFGAGEHVLCWNYWKDGSNSEGMDMGWVDQVAWTPAKTLTPVPVPYTWLDQYPVLLALAGGDYEAAALADVDGDGHMAWQEYVTGSVPTNRESVLRSLISVSNGAPWITWSPDLGSARVYTVEGKTNLNEAVWGPTNAGSSFFRVKVGMP